MIFFIPYTASGFAACGKLFHSLFGADYMTAMVLSALVIVCYTLMGGFSAVCTTDLVQSIVMSIALITVMVFGISNAGGFTAVMDNARSLPGYFSLTKLYDATTGNASSYGGIIPIISTLAWGIGYFGMPHILVRFMSIEDEKKLVLSRRIATIWVVIAMTVAVFIGVVGLGMVKYGSIGALDDPETVIMAITNLLSKHGILPALLAGVILAGVLAATMSTSDSQLLAAASGISQKREIFLARITIIIIAVVGVLMARDPNSSVFGIVSFAWAGFGGAFGAVMLFSLFWKRCNLAGALSGMVAGGVVVFVWKYFVRPLGGAFDIYELLPAFLVSCVVIVIVSLLTKAPDEAVIKEFDAANIK